MTSTVPTEVFGTCHCSEYVSFMRPVVQDAADPELKSQLLKTQSCQSFPLLKWNGADETSWALSSGTE